MSTIDMPAPASNASAIEAELAGLSPRYAATPLRDLPRLASRLGVRQVLVKDEGQRALGSFKSLGGTYAGLRALARHAGLSVGALIVRRPQGLPALVCASDGNHGSAVAMAARLAGTQARVFLHDAVPATRARRIEAEGAELVWVRGTYDDAVASAAFHASSGDDILVADTTGDHTDSIVADVMAGYGVIASEVRRQIAEAGHARPTHVFVQAGVGGLAAAMAQGLEDWLAKPARFVVVEPTSAACLAAAFAARRPIRIDGALHTGAEMLSCGVASAPALAILLQHQAEVALVEEAVLSDAPRCLREAGGPSTTPSGAAGLAGVMATLADAAAADRLKLTAVSRILLFATEGEAEGSFIQPTEFSGIHGRETSLSDPFPLRSEGSGLCV